MALGCLVAGCSMPLHMDSLFERTDKSDVTGSIKNAAAAQAAERAVTAVPDSADLQASLGALLIKVGKADEGIAHLTEAVRLRPGLQVSMMKNCISRSKRLDPQRVTPQRPDPFTFGRF